MQIPATLPQATSANHLAAPDAQPAALLAERAIEAAADYAEDSDYAGVAEPSNN